MPTVHACPKCGANCYVKAIIPGIVFGYYCEKCDLYFNMWKIVIGWNR